MLANPPVFAAGTRDKLTFSPDGHHVIAHGIGVLPVWDAETGKSLYSQAPGGSLRTVTASEDNRLVAGVFYGSPTPVPGQRPSFTSSTPIRVSRCGRHRARGLPPRRKFPAKG